MGRSRELAELAASYDSGNLFGMKNRIINGAMVIDQRNAGASVNTNQAFPVDRFKQPMSGGGVLTSQQSSTAPAGFSKSLSITVSTADASIAAADYYMIAQAIEGYNIADLGWGTASASAVTLSFWVRSSVTGTFSGGVENDAGNRGYVFTYTINSANTWEYKTITIPGDTSGTWLTTNAQGIGLFFDLGTGTDRCITTANTWGAQRGIGLQSATKLISTLNATFYITGVQLEKGSTATSFDYRPYGTELQLCQRYYQVFFPPGYRFFSSTTATSGFSVSTERLSVDMRATPSLGQTSGSSCIVINVAANTSTTQTAVLEGASANTWRFYPSAGMSTSVIYMIAISQNVYASAEL